MRIAIVGGHSNSSVPFWVESMRFVVVLAAVLLALFGESVVVSGQERDVRAVVSGGELKADDQQTPGNKNGKRSLTSDRANELVSAAVTKFHQDIRAGDRETRVKAIQSMQPNEKQLAALFGEGNGKICLEAIKPRLDAMITHVDKVSEQLTRDGKFIRVDLEKLKIPTAIEMGALGKLMKDIAPETYRFKAQIRTEKFVSHSSSYFVILGDVVYLDFNELIQIARRLNAGR